MLVDVTDTKGRIHTINPIHIVKLTDKTLYKETPITGILMVNSEKNIVVYGTKDEVKMKLNID
jgi:uncharacterized protein YlzI (FlbEa/FlbD family)